MDLRYKTLNFGAEKSPGSSNWWTQIDLKPDRGGACKRNDDFDDDEQRRVKRRHLLSVPDHLRFRFFGQEGRYKATSKREFEVPRREAGLPNHLDDDLDDDEQRRVQRRHLLPVPDHLPFGLQVLLACNPNITPEIAGGACPSW